MARKKNPFPTIKTSIEIGAKIWQCLEIDSVRSRRAVTKQLEMILGHYYGIADGNIDEAAIERVRKELSLKAFTPTGIQVEE